jgi:hypothetical protein
MGQGEVMALYFLSSYADPHVPFAYQCMFGKSLAFENFSSQISMTDIGMFTRTAEFRGMGEENADVVQHGSFPDKIKIRVKVGHFFGGTYGLVRHLFSMLYENVIGSGAGLIKFG